MEIRELTSADRDAAIAIWEEAGLTRPWNDPTSDFDLALSGTTSAVLGAVDVGELAATVMVGHDGHRGWVYYLAVGPTNRRRGLGRRMMQAAESWLREHEAVKLNVMVRRTNAAALGFYERLGYEDAEVMVLARWLAGPVQTASQQSWSLALDAARVARIEDRSVLP
jgi:ribosomal protein S18 acetylase RimI-like enzyme